MSFRRDGRRSHRWKAWVRTNQEFLDTQCGLPVSVINDWEEWSYFLDHATPMTAHFPEPTAKQWKSLRDFLTREGHTEFTWPGVLFFGEDGDSDES